MINLLSCKKISLVTSIYFILFLLKGKIIAFEIKKKTLIFSMSDFFNIKFPLKIVFLFWGNYQNESFSILSWFKKNK